MGAGVDSTSRLKPRMSAKRTVASRQSPGSSRIPGLASARSTSRGETYRASCERSAPSWSSAARVVAQVGERALKLGVLGREIGDEPFALTAQPVMLDGTAHHVDGARADPRASAGSDRPRPR